MMKDAIETAIKMETDAIAFYGEASNKTRHLKILQDIFRGNDINIELKRPKDTIKTVFSMLKDEMMQRVNALDSELEAVNIALKFEKEGFDFYRESAGKAESPKEKELFDKLSTEENDHYTILLETHKFLENTGQWYMYEEKGIVEG